MRELKPYTKSARLTEIYSTGMQFSFVSPNDEICHNWVLCKDFLTDTVWATVNQQKASIYGFSYSPETNPPISLNPVKLVVRDKQVSDTKFDEEMRQCLHFLNAVERKLKFAPSTLEQVSNGEKYPLWMFICDKRWIHAPPMISMLTLYIRAGRHYKEGTFNQALKYFKTLNTHDSRYIDASKPLRLLIMKKGISIFNDKMEDNYPSDSSISVMHNSCGIVNGKNSKIKGWDFSEIDKPKPKPKSKRKTVKVPMTLNQVLIT